MRSGRAGWSVLCAVVLTAAQAVAADATPPFEAQVTRKEANVRAGSSIGSEALATLSRGSHVSVISEHAGWYRIRLPQSARCYVAAQYVNAGGLLTGNHINVRAGAGRQFSILGQLRRGDHVRVLEQQGEWARVEPPPALSGWIRADLVAPIAAAAAVSAGPLTTAIASSRTHGAVQPPVGSPGVAATTVAPAVDASKTAARTPPTAMGVVETTRGFRQPSKHCLTDGGQTLFYLRSADVDLSQYKHQRVAVWGAMDPTIRSPHLLVIVQRVERVD